jgi:hypothetical protein
LFTPEDLVALLLKMKNEFGLERMHNILQQAIQVHWKVYIKKLATTFSLKQEH